MSTTDIYEFLKANPEKSFSNKDLAILLGINVATAGANTKKLRENGLINYDIQKTKHNKRKLRYLFFCNKSRAPVFYDCNGVYPRNQEYHALSPHMIKNQRLLEKNYQNSGKYTILESHATRQTYNEQL